MTSRTQRPPELRPDAPDFSKLSRLQAQRCIHQLKAQGTPEPTIACWFGLSAQDLWRVLGERTDADHRE